VQIIRAMARVMVLAFYILVLGNIASVPPSSAARLLGTNNKTKISTIEKKVKSYLIQNGLGQTPPMGYVIPSLCIHSHLSLIEIYRFFFLSLFFLL